MSAVGAGSAFPLPQWANEDGRRGMTLRDYFAAQVLAAFIANPNVVVANPNCGFSYCNTSAEGLANDAYMCADAMLKEREK